MNKIYSQMRHICFEEHDVQKFEVKINNSKVIMWSNDSNLNIRIEGTKSISKLEKLFFDIYSLIFLYIGAYPKILVLEKNDIEIDLCNYVEKYESSSLYVKRNLLICNINSKSINEEVLNVFNV